MYWLRRWRRARPRWAPPAPIPDGDTVLGPGQRQRWADLLAPTPTEPASEPSTEPVPEPPATPLAEPTRLLPLVRPLMTRAGWWRATRGSR